MEETDFSEEDFKELCGYLNRLDNLAELANRFHNEGLDRKELDEFLSLLAQSIEQNTGRDDLPLLATIN